MTHDRVTELWVENVRVLETVRIRLNGLTVLIGENGSGKSSVLEVCELLRLASEAGGFVDALRASHGGLGGIRRFDAPHVKVGVRIEGDGAPLTYEFAVADNGSDVVVSEERLVVEETADQPGEVVIDRTLSKVQVHERGSLIEIKEVNRGGLLIVSYGERPPHPAIGRLRSALSAIEIHLPFEVTPGWFARSTRRGWGMRAAVPFSGASTLERLGANLPNAYQSLKNGFGDEHWQETMEYVRLGLGEEVESVNVLDYGGGESRAWLEVSFRGGNGTRAKVPAAGLSDGMLTYLALVALARLPAGRTLLAFDEPDLHLHPLLLMRALDLFEELAEDAPVLVATHSDRMLDGLSEPVRSVVLCQLDEQRKTRFLRPDEEALERWLKRYRGFGDIRAAGHESSVMTNEESS